MTDMKTEEDKKLKLYLITGLSGAGKSSALKVLEDLDYEAIDNLPVSLMPNVVDMMLKDMAGGRRPALALGIDARTRNFQPERILKSLEKLRKRDDITLRIVFFDSQNEVLAQRFSATRRKHPGPGPTGHRRHRPRTEDDGRYPGRGGFHLRHLGHEHS